MKYILNTPVLTDYGDYRFEQISLEQARELAQGAISAVGHQGAAEALTSLLGVSVEINRQKITMQSGDCALVFKITERLPEGAVLSVEDTLNLPYEFGRLEKIS
ncbi:MAG: DUF1874 domain-containing protein [Syntrophaceae bacterium]|jgi:hypothetical protein|nr:DUF1874 domain-containing protein [Syntrophaceae bacterium]